MPKPWLADRQKVGFMQTSENYGGDGVGSAVRCRHLVPNRPSLLGVERRFRFACCWLITGATTFVAVGCSSSPRAEYLMTRSTEVAPTNEGDGTTLAQRNDVLRGNLAGATAVVPLASVKPDLDDSRQ